MRKMFVSYRQRGSMIHAGRITDTLIRHFGKKNIFHDKSILQGGINWKNSIEKSLNECNVLIAVIDPDWLNHKNPDGSRRIDSPNDYVALEISTALKRDVTVIPLLISGAKRLYEHELPKDLKELSFIEPLEIEDDDWHYGMNKLIESVYIFNRDPRRIGWRNITSLCLAVIGMVSSAEDVVPIEASFFTIFISFIAFSLSVSSYLYMKEIASVSRTWSVIAIIISILLIIMSVDDLIPDKYF